MTKCQHCDKPIAEYRLNTSEKLTWRHSHSLRIYCTSYTKAKPKKEAT